MMKRLNPSKPIILLITILNCIKENMCLKMIEKCNSPEDSLDNTYFVDDNDDNNADGTLMFISDPDTTSCTIRVEAICQSGSDLPGLSIIRIYGDSNSHRLSLTERYKNTFYKSDFTAEIEDEDALDGGEITVTTDLWQHFGNESNDDEYKTVTRSVTIQLTENEDACADRTSFALIILRVSSNVSGLNLVPITFKTYSFLGATTWNCSVIEQLNECSTEKCLVSENTAIPQRLYTCEELYTCPITEFDCGCSKASSLSTREARIIGGNIVLPGEFPWIAFLDVVLDKNNNRSCGATLINTETIITSWHCLIGYEEIFIFLGLTDLDEKTNKTITQIRKPKTVRGHPDYDAFSNANDVAVIMLDEPAVISFRVDVICSPFSSSAKETEKKRRKGRAVIEGVSTAIIIGFGKTSESSDELSTTLMKAEVDILADQECFDMYDKLNYYVDTTRFFCATKPAVNACEGDCGGPVMVRKSSNGPYEMAGTISFGIKCSNGVHSKIDDPNIISFVKDALLEN